MSDLYSDGKWDDFDKSMRLTREEFDRWLETKYRAGVASHSPLRGYTATPFLRRSPHWLAVSKKERTTPGVRCSDFDGACKDVQHMNCWVEHAKKLTEDSKELDGYCPYLLGQEPK